MSVTYEEKEAPGGKPLVCDAECALGPSVYYSNLSMDTLALVRRAVTSETLLPIRMLLFFVVFSIHGKTGN